MGSALGGAAYLFGFAYLVLSACGLHGAIEYKTGFVRAAVVGYCIKAVLTIIGLIVIGVNTYYDWAPLIIGGVICK